MARTRGDASLPVFAESAKKCLSGGLAGGKMNVMKLKKTTVDEDAPTVVDSGSGGGAFIAARFRNPADDYAPAGATTGEKVCAIIAIVSTLILGAVCAMQYLQYAQ